MGLTWAIHYLHRPVDGAVSGCLVELVRGKDRGISSGPRGEGPAKSLFKGFIATQLSPPVWFSSIPLPNDGLCSLQGGM